MSPVEVSYLVRSELTYIRSSTTKTTISRGGDGWVGRFYDMPEYFDFLMIHRSRRCDWKLRAQFIKDRYLFKFDYEVWRYIVDHPHIRASRQSTTYNSTSIYDHQYCLAFDREDDVVALRMMFGERMVISDWK